jgi:hypothetical protein
MVVALGGRRLAVRVGPALGGAVLVGGLVRALV